MKEKSKIMLMEDPMSHERRHIEMKRTSRIEKASRAIIKVSLDVDKLVG